VYTDDELAYCNAGGPNRFGRLAARFAAKEATLKALRPTDDGISWTSIEVVREPGGWCDVRLTGAAAELAARAGIRSLALSVTHEQGLAAAVVVAQVSQPVPPKPGDPA
jgi:holo-[acyl-carrier protein] synthase